MSDAVRTLAEIIVAEEGRGHNDPPLLCDYETGDDKTAEQAARYLDQARWIVACLNEHGWELVPRAR